MLPERKMEGLPVGVQLGGLWISQFDVVVEGEVEAEVDIALGAEVGVEIAIDNRIGDE